MTDERKEKLESIGFDWEVRDKNGTDASKWEKQFGLLCNFKRAHGHTEVPTDYSVNGVRLGVWAIRQRSCHKNEKWREGERKQNWTR